MDSSKHSSYNYDVFLSFRGTDTRRDFADCLYTALTGATFSVFRDEEEIPFGEYIDRKIVEMVSQSKISIPIFSKNYAESRSCLMEVAKMMECKQHTDHLVKPIFFDVTPSMVKHQTGTFEGHFRKHENDNQHDTQTIQTWRNALKHIAGLKGWEVSMINDGHFSTVIASVVSDVVKTLNKSHLLIPKNLIGITGHVNNVLRKLATASTGVRIVVIHGLAAVGKTTLAKFVYNQICDSFDGCCLLEDVKEAFNQASQTNARIRDLHARLISGLLRQKKEEFGSRDAGLQFIKHRFRQKNVLILLDDVDTCEQLKALVGDGNWFGKSSRIIVTSNKGNAFASITTDFFYQMEPMEKKQALELFSWHAFKTNIPKKGYDSLSEDIASLIGGFPLVLETTGSSLFNKEKRIWEDKAKMLRENPDSNLMGKLMISYKDLDHWEKQIFLDIACFFIGKDQRFAFYMWESCNFYPSAGICSLLNKSLVKIGGNGELLMHDQLRNLGRKIVQNENLHKPGKRSRLWKHVDAFRILKDLKGTDQVEGLSLTFGDDQDINLNSMGFRGLTNVRFLKLDQAAIQGDFEQPLSSLRWLDWEGCCKIDDVVDKNSESLVVLELSSSKVNQNQDSWKKLMMATKKLKVLNLKGCANLRGFPCFPAEMDLQMLILESCHQLIGVDESIRNLKHLIYLNLRFCREVKQLPKGLSLLKDLKELLIDGTSISKLHFLNGSMEKLEILTAGGCKNLAELKESIGHLKSLKRLTLDDTIIEKLPSSISSLKSLQRLSLRNCKKLLQLPPSVGDMTSLIELDLSNTRIDKLPPSFKDLEYLKVLKMEGCMMQEFPGVLSYLSKIEELDFSVCRCLSGDMSSIIMALVALRILRLSHTEVSSLGSTLLGLSDLEVLDLLGCDKLQMLPMLPSMLSCLRVGSTSLCEFPDLSTLTHLKKLHLRFDPKAVTSQVFNSFEWISSLSNLETLELHLLSPDERSIPVRSRTLRSIPVGFLALSRLEKLTLSGVDLPFLQYFPQSLSTLSLQRCKSSERGPYFSNLRGLSELEFLDCPIEEIQSLEHLEALQILKLSHCSVKDLKGLNRLTNLRVLKLLYCEFQATSSLKLLREEELEIEIEFCNFAYAAEDLQHRAHWGSTPSV